MENLIKLPFIHRLHTNLAEKNGLLQVLLGPRQVGKTTTILSYLQSHHSNQHHYVSADSVFNASASWIREQWQIASRTNSLLVIDEIQKCENWSEAIKSLWDEAKRSKKYVPCLLLGSSSLSIQRGLTESLTGRFQLIQAFHWNVRESLEGYGLDFKSYTKFGGYPGAYPFISKDQKEWRSFVSGSILSTVIEKDILQYHAVRSPALFKQAFEMIAAYPAREISYTKLLGQLQGKGNVELIKYYLNLYQGAYLIKVLEKFTLNQIRVKSSSPKILPLAPCIYYLTHLDDYSSDEFGHVFEAIVGSQLVRTGEDLYYWREGKYEVDYVLRRGKKIWAIEVKSGRKKITDGLSAFKKQYPQAKAVVISISDYEVFESDPMKYLESCQC